MKKMKAILAATVTVALAAVMLAGCSSGEGAAKSDNQGSTAGDKMVLTVGFDQSYPPYGFVGDDGQFTGFDLDLAKAVCDKNGWELKLQPIDWPAKDALLGSGAINCVWNGFTIEGRETKYEFTEPYMLNEQVVVVKAGSDIKTLADLKDKVVMTQADSAALDVLEKDQKDLAGTFKELQTIGDYDNAFMQLESGIVDAVACDLSIADFQIAGKANAFTKLDPLSTEHYGVGFKLGEKEMAQKVTDTLKALDADGTVKQLCEKYSKYGITYDNWVL